MKATVAVPAGPPFQDAEGSTVLPPAPPAAVLEAPCRAESATMDGRRPVRDGVRYDYSWLVYTGLGLPALPMGTVVEIVDAATGEPFGSGKVAAHEKNQRGAGVWLV